MLNTIGTPSGVQKAKGKKKGKKFVHEDTVFIFGDGRVTVGYVVGYRGGGDGEE